MLEMASACFLTDDGAQAARLLSLGARGVPIHPAAPPSQAARPPQEAPCAVTERLEYRGSPA